MMPLHVADRRMTMGEKAERTRRMPPGESPNALSTPIPTDDC